MIIDSTYGYLELDGKMSAEVLLIRLKFLGYTFKGTPMLSDYDCTSDVELIHKDLDLYELKNFRKNFLEEVKYILVNRKYKRIMWILTGDQTKELDILNYYNRITIEELEG